MSEPPDQLITGLFCPTCGYDMTGHDRANRVTCPECGDDHGLDDLWTRPPRGHFDRIAMRIGQSPSFRPSVAILIFMVVAAVIIGLTPNRIEQAKLVNVMTPMRNIQATTFTWADEHDDLLPPHPAQVILEGWLPPDIFIDRDVAPGKQQTHLHAVSLSAPFHGTPQEVALLTAAMQLAIENADSTYFQLGDYFFARWPDGWKLSDCVPSEDLVLVWGKVRADGLRPVAFARGHIEDLTEDEFAAAWRRDSAARTGLGIPVISADVVRNADK